MQQTPRIQAKVAQDAPITESAFFVLINQRDELKAQLKAMSQRRNDLDEQRRALRTEDRADHEARIKAIDQRSADIDRQIMSLDIAIAKARSQPIIKDAPAPQATSPIVSVPPPLGRTPEFSSDREKAKIVGGLGFSAVALYAMFLAARRFLKPNVTPVEGSSRRLDQLQNSIDVIALEVERMSESQRFIAKVLNEKFPALGVGEAQPLTAKAKDAAKV